MRVQREQETLVASAVPEALHDRKQRRQTKAQAPVRFRNRHAQHAELRAAAPCITIEGACFVGRDDVVIERLSRERDGRFLQAAVLLRKVHSCGFLPLSGDGA